jgi:hypothetical protein
MYSKCWKKKYCWPRILYLERLSLKNEKPIKIFSVSHLAWCWRAFSKLKQHAKKQCKNMKVWDS